MYSTIKKHSVLNVKILLLFFLPLLFSCKKDSTDQAAIDRGIIQKYISEHGLTADSTASGLYYVITNPGSGATPNSNSYVSVFYKGYFTNGNVFDERVTSPVPFSLRN